jgi:hypothetical protein
LPGGEIVSALQPMGISMDPTTVFVAAFIFGYVAELALPWIWRRWFGSSHEARSRRHARKNPWRMRR